MRISCLILTQGNTAHVVNASKVNDKVYDSGLYILIFLFRR